MRSADIPARIKLLHRLAVETQRVAASQLEWRFVVGMLARAAGRCAFRTGASARRTLVDVPHVAGERLDRDGRQERAQLGEMRAAGRAGQQTGGITTEVAEQI